MNRYYIFAISFLISLCANAITIEQAKKLYDNGKYTEALSGFKELLKKSPKNTNLNYYVGLCLYDMNEQEQSIPYLTFAQSKSVPDASKYLAYIAYFNYDFEEALNHIESYQMALTKAKKEMPEDMEQFLTRVVNARNMLERVENIQIIDSINVDSNTFFKFYKISRECGSLNATTILPNGFESAPYTVVFQPESKSQMMWAAHNANGKESIVTSAILSDNTWEQPHELDENINTNNSNYPFIMSDGVTLYFANDGENSIGGYDIFFTRKDEDGYLQPQNMGMPYNSLHNDYMLVIDEITGVGWWASDRNNIEGQVTIYKFIPNETRSNYPANTPNLINLAKICSIKDSWAENADYSEILNRLTEVTTSDKADSSKSFTLSLPNGKVYNSIDDFSNQSAAEAMQEYLDAVKEYNATINRASSLRKTYSNGDKSVANEIIEIENEILTQQKTLTTLRNTVVSLECQ